MEPENSSKIRRVVNEIIAPFRALVMPWLQIDLKIVWKVFTVLIDEIFYTIQKPWYGIDVVPVESIGVSDIGSTIVDLVVIR